MNRVIFHLMGLLVCLVVGACSGNGDDGSDAGTQDGADAGNGDQQQDPRVEITQVFSDSTTGVFSERMSWAADDSLVAFAGSPADIYKVAPQAGATPVKVTGRTEQEWHKGGYSPTCLADGRIAYWVGAIESDYNMHIMVAGPDQENNLPEPAVFRVYNGSDVGLEANYAASPAHLSMSANGEKAAAGYGGLLWILDWSGGDVQATSIGNSGEHTEAMLSSDGTKVAYLAASGNVAWMNSDGTGQQELEPGMSPTWSWDGNLLGYLNQTTDAYRVYDLAGQSTTSYKLPAGAYIDVALSSDGTRIAIRTFGGPVDGIAVGELVKD